MFSSRLIELLCVVLLGSCVDPAIVSATEHVETHPAKQTELRFGLFNGLIIVKGNIGSLKDVNIILDTGTSPTTISTDIADRLQLRGNRELQLTLNGLVQVQKVTLSGLEIGGICSDSVSVVVQDLSFVDQFVGMRIAGIAGLDVLSSGTFTIDYQKRKIFFGGSEATEKSAHFERRAPFLTVKAKIDGRELELLVDSGTTGILVYRKRFEPGSERLYFDNTLVKTATGTSQSEWFDASNVSLGNENLGRRQVIIADSDPVADDFDGLLGFVSLGFHRVTFDFDHGLLGWN